MDGARLSRYPHLSWLRFEVDKTHPSSPRANTLVSECHAINVVAFAPRPITATWIKRGKETQLVSPAGAVQFSPADDEEQTYISKELNYVVRVLLLPPGHLNDCLVSEEYGPHFEWHHFFTPNDAILRDCMLLVHDADGAGIDGLDGRADEAARRLILRLAELCGGGKPDWHDDVSVFDRRTLLGLVSCIDDNLRIAPTLSEISLRTGLSPSHFAKKFRQTTGLSLHRFVNRRRILRSLDTLKDQSQSLAGIALGLGFSSQSHFTRLFSGLTGMTPAKYQKQFRRTVG